MTSESLNMEQKEAGLEKKLKIQSPGAEEAGGNNAQSTSALDAKEKEKVIFRGQSFCRFAEA